MLCFSDMINPDLDFELPSGVFPNSEEASESRDALPMEALQWRSLYWARHGVPPPDANASESALPSLEFRFPEDESH